MSDDSNQFNIELLDWDDGHKPGSTSTKTNLGFYSNKCASDFVSVVDNLLPELWRQRIYSYSMEKKRPWGVYVTTNDMDNDKLQPELIWESYPERAIGLLVTRILLFQHGASVIKADRHRIHGTAIWSLTSGLTNSVEYHIDYAELYRYETNIIYPPLYAGTIHVSPFRKGDMTGGDFMVNMGGLEHYKKFGYKAALVSSDVLESDLKDGDWMTIPYKCNRGIFMDGNLPHLSSPVTSLPMNTKRVILGLNCFTQEVGECCERAPEHSDAFNRTVKLYQAMAAIGIPITATASSSHSYDTKYSTAISTSTISSSSITDPLPINNSPSLQIGNQTNSNSSSCSSIGEQIALSTDSPPTQNYSFTNIDNSNFNIIPQTATTTTIAVENKSDEDVLPTPPPRKPVQGISSRDVLKNPALGKLLVTAARKLKLKMLEEESAKKNLEHNNTMS